MILQTNTVLETIALYLGVILEFFMPIVMPIGEFVVTFVTAATEFLHQNFGENFTIYIIIGAILIISGVIINIVWPGDKKGSIYSSIEKIEELDPSSDVTEKAGESFEPKRCKDCGNPIGDQNICPLCGARN